MRTIETASELPSNSPPPPPVSKIAPFPCSALLTWSFIVCIEDPPPKEAIFAPPRIMPSASTSPLRALVVEDFGRFAGKYRSVRSVVYHMDDDSEIVSEEVYRKGKPLPDELN